MLKLKNEEIRIVVFIFIFLIGLTFFNLRISLRKSRDAQRRADVNSIFDAISKYQNEFGFFPLSSDDGKILACRDDSYSPPPQDLPEAEFQKYFILSLTECEWGSDSLRDIGDLSYEPYLSTIPQDPYHNRGYSYYYVSNTRRFQVFAHLEGGPSEEGFKQGIVDRNLMCGNKICNFGKAFSDEDITKNLEEIEDEFNTLN